MKKFLSILSLSSISLLFIECSSDTNNEDSALLQEVQGKWKLTEYFTDIAEEEYLVDDGYELELKSNKTFSSDEVPGYTGGVYTVINKPGKNIKLLYQNNSGSVVVYKYINGTQPNTIYLQSSNPEPGSDEWGYFAGEVLSRIP